MRTDKKWMKTALTLLVGFVLGVAVHGVGERWSRKADASSIDALARNTLAQLVQAIPTPGGNKIKGVSGIGDGKTFVIWTSDQIYFYQMAFPTRQ